ncbi:MAG: aminotransferase class III-fold pyridoxal phosphate-dependent enzyme [Cyclobacteriaceae bacterium]
MTISQLSWGDPQLLATELASRHYGLHVAVTQLVGEFDWNFKLDSEDQSYLLKVSRSNPESDFHDFQMNLMEHVATSSPDITAPAIIKNLNGNSSTTIEDEDGNVRKIRLLTWMHGRLWSDVSPKSDSLRRSLGINVGMLTKSFQNFDHPYAHRDFEWDVAQSYWTVGHLSLFNNQQKELVQHFQRRFKEIEPAYSLLRKSVIHNDANDNNVIVSADLKNPQVVSIIDYGDAIFTQSINDLAIALAYAIMDVPDPLQAALALIKGYHSSFPLLEEELEVLYILIGMRLVTTVTKSAINKTEDPNNEYLQVSEKPAWELLSQWAKLNEQLVHYSFRSSCGFTAHPAEAAFVGRASNQQISLNTPFPTLDIQGVTTVDMSVGSTWLGHSSHFHNNAHLAYALAQVQNENPKSVIANGYLETRPIYSTETYNKEGNNGPEYRTVHLGVDFWVEEMTPVHSILEGEVFAVHNNDNDKDYGPTVILKHLLPTGEPFYSLYGHLSTSSLEVLTPGHSIKTGDLIGHIGRSDENGNWAPHLHFQLMLDMLSNVHDFPGVSTPKEIEAWKSICPDPNLLFQREELNQQTESDDTALIKFRKDHLGKGLSLSYNEPLKMVRGDGACLIDSAGRRYLDTVNNVAHVGHEHPRVVEAGQKQMAVLNTNTRYLHPNIADFAKELLQTFPDELSVVHFVNSGSEANELAIRMAKAYSREKDFIAIEVGYHGNTNANIGISSYKFDGKGGKGAPEHTHIVPLPDSFRGIYQGENESRAYSSHVQEQVDHIQAMGRNVAGFICESIISCGGQIELPKGYLEEAYASVREAGGLCIADEVQVGCGRVGSHFWGFEMQGVVPDIVTIGKPIGNGHPLAAVVCTQKVAKAFANGMEYFNTFGGNPVSSAIGKEVLSVLKDEKLQENALQTGEYLKNGLRTLQHTFPIIADVRGQGLFLGFELCTKEKAPLPDHADYLVNRMKELGILMSTDGPDHNVLKIKPPMVFGKKHADELLNRLDTVLKEDFMQIVN